MIDTLKVLSQNFPGHANQIQKVRVRRDDRSAGEAEHTLFVAQFCRLLKVWHIRKPRLTAFERGSLGLSGFRNARVQQYLSRCKVGVIVCGRPWNARQQQAGAIYRGVPFTSGADITCAPPSFLPPSFPPSAKSKDTKSANQ